MPADVELAVTVTKKGDGADKVGRDLKEAARAADRLDDDLKAVNRQLVEMKVLAGAAAQEFQRTGDKSPLKQVLKDTRELSQVKKSLSEAKDELDKFVQAGETVGKGLFSDLGSAVSEGGSAVAQKLGQAISSNPYVALGVAAAIVAGAPAIGAAASSAVLLGIGGATLAGGILLAARNGQVQAAWADFGHSAMQQLSASADVFVVPLKNAATIFGDAFRDILPRIRAGFATLAPMVESLAHGIAGFVREIGPGLSKAFAASGPVLQTLADHLPRLGAAMGDFFTSIAHGGPGAAKFFGDLLTFVEIDIVALGRLIEFLSKAYLYLSAYSQLLAGDAAHAAVTFGQAGQGIPPLLDDVGAGAQAAGKDLATLSGELNATEVSADSLAGAMTDKILNSMLSMDHAVLGFRESLTKLNDGFKKGHITLDITKAKGQEFRESVLSSVQANLQEYDTLLKVGASAEDAARAYDANTRALEGQLHKLGLTQGQIDGLIGKYRGVPDKVNTDIAAHGLTQAINDLAQLIRDMNGLDGRQIKVGVDYYEYRHDERQTPSNTPQPKSYSRTNVRAAGGPVWPGGTFLVGEEAPEILTIGAGGLGMVTPLAGASRPASAALGAPARLPLAGVRGGGGGGGTTVVVQPQAAAGALERVLAGVVGQMLSSGQLQLKVSNSGRVVPA